MVKYRNHNKPKKNHPWVMNSTGFTKKPKEVRDITAYVAEGRVYKTVKKSGASHLSRQVNKK